MSGHTVSLTTRRTVRKMPPKGKKKQQTPTPPPSPKTPTKPKQTKDEVKLKEYLDEEVYTETEEDKREWERMEREANKK